MSQTKFDPLDEEYILGALMNYGEGVELCDKLDSRYFRKPQTQFVWQAIRELADAGTTYLLETVHTAMARSGVLERIGGFAYLVELQGYGCSLATLHVHVKDLVNRAMTREVAIVADRIAGDATDDANADALLEHAEREFLSLQSRRETRNEMSTKDLVAAAMLSIQAKHKHGGITGMETGFAELDEQLGGLQEGALYILAARPAMGKTCLALNIATRAAVSKRQPVVMFSLEMSGRELSLRMISAEGRVDTSNPRKFSDADWIRVERGQAAIVAAPMTVVDSSALKSTELRSHARKLHAQGKCKLLVVDYLQLMSGDAESREREIGEISRSLKLLAKELGIPVLALSQLNRGVENRADKRPSLADLRDSGSIEQDADAVMFIYRDEVYNPQSQDRGYAELIVAKNRHGAVGKVRLRFTPEHQRFDPA